MLELRPSCEHCNKKLPVDSVVAMICSFECTFCKSCVDTVLHNVCPNCGGGFNQRPVRPQTNLKNNNYTGRYPATDVVTFKPLNADEHRKFSATIKKLAPEER